MAKVQTKDFPMIPARAKHRRTTPLGMPGLACVCFVTLAVGLLPTRAESLSGPETPPGTNAVLLISGTYPHLSVFTDEGECGLGAVASWNERLWFLTYPPHHPGTGPDKLWMVDTNLALNACAESVGGTHANRMIHRESRQLIMGPYFIDTSNTVRVVSRTEMPGRLTGTPGTCWILPTRSSSPRWKRGSMRWMFIHWPSR